MTKLCVSMEQKMCGVCGTVYDSGSILLDTRIRKGKLCDSMERTTITGYGLCEEHQKLFDDGYIALVECNNKAVTDHLKPEDVNRTGNICHISRMEANALFNIEFPQNFFMAFVEIGVLDKLSSMIEKENT